MSLKEIKYHVNCKTTILLFLLIVFNEVSIAQSQEIKEKNLTRLDSFLKNGIKDLCRENLVNSKEYRPKKIKTEQQIVSFLNKIYTGNLGQSALTKELFQLRKLKSFRKAEAHGAILNERIVLRGPYLNSEIKLAFIDGILISAKTEIETGDNTRCGKYGYIVPDFYLFRNSYVENFSFPVYPGYYGLESDTIFYDNIRLLSGKLKQYKFLIPDSKNEKWIDTILKKQYEPDIFCCYNHREPPREFVRLIKENKIDIIADLLFSPDYLMAINAMESLIYLESVKKHKLTTGELRRIDEIKKGNNSFLSQGAPDVLYNRKGYAELSMTEERIINKYNVSF